MKRSHSHFSRKCNFSRWICFCAVPVCVFMFLFIFLCFHVFNDGWTPQQLVRTGGQGVVSQVPSAGFLVSPRLMSPPSSRDIFTRFFCPNSKNGLTVPLLFLLYFSWGKQKSAQTLQTFPTLKVKNVISLMEKLILLDDSEVVTVGWFKKKKTWVIFNTKMQRWIVFKRNFQEILNEQQQLINFWKQLYSRWPPQQTDMMFGSVAQGSVSLRSKWWSFWYRGRKPVNI